MTKSIAKPRIVLVSIDNQNDFIKKDGRLSVPNAVLAAHRAATFIDTNIADIEHIIHTFDQHREEHIFYPMWWVNNDGQHPNEYSDITAQSVIDGTWTPVYEKDWSVEYAKKLKSFTIWPEHCTENTSGAKLFQAIQDATDRHSAFHNTTPTDVIKGLHKKTENYGAFAPEVEDPSDPSTKPNTALMEIIANYDRSYWCGEERGHCVRRSLEQYIAWCKVNAPEAIAKIRYLDDCISTLEFGETYKNDIEESIQSMVRDGMIVVKSTDPIS